MKECVKCGEVKELNLFRVSSSSNDVKKHRNQCRDCDNKYTLERAKQRLIEDPDYNKRFYIKNKEYYAAHNKRYKEENKESIAISKKKWYSKNIEKMLKYRKDQYKENKAKSNEQSRLWRLKNKEKVKEYNKLDIKKKVEEMPDSYIIGLLTRNNQVSKENITPEIIKVKRYITKINRLIKSKKA